MSFHSEKTLTGSLLKQLREHFATGGNVTQLAKELLGTEQNHLIGILMAYDLQAGSYVVHARDNADGHSVWCDQVADAIRPFLTPQATVLEVGCGECTTLAGVYDRLRPENIQAFAFDISWSRLAVGRQWMSEHHCRAQLFLADLLNIPLADSSVDIVYSSHSLEPNGGKEAEAIAECLRVAKNNVILVEPIYELATEAQQARMRSHGYVRGLRETAERLGAEVLDCRLLPYSGNPMNPSGIIVLSKPFASRDANAVKWRCPLSGCELVACEEGYFAADAGLVYPVIRGIPALRAEHAIVASKFADF